MAFSNYSAGKKNCSNVYKQVVKKLGEDCASKSLSKELAQVNVELAEASIQYFKHKLVVDCVKKFLDLKVTKRTLNKEQGILSDSFYLTYLKKYSSTDGIQTFGVTEDFIEKTIKRKQKTKEEKEELNKFVENEIDIFCVKVSEYAGYGQRSRGNQCRVFQEAVKDLMSQCDGLVDAKFKLEAEEKEINDLLTSYFENLMHGVSMLKSLSLLNKEKIDFHSLLGDLYQSRQNTLASKINRFEHQILVATYHKKSVQVLTKIREELDQKKEVIDNDLNTTNSELQKYTALEPQFGKLVDEYSELLIKIQNLEWAVDSVSGRPSFGGSISDRERLLNSSELESEPGCSRIDESSRLSTQSGTSDSSIFIDTLNNSVFDKTADNTVANSSLDETADNSKVLES